MKDTGWRSWTWWLGVLGLLGDAGCHRPATPTVRDGGAFLNIEGPMTVPERCVVLAVVEQLVLDGYASLARGTGPEVYLNARVVQTDRRAEVSLMLYEQGDQRPPEMVRGRGRDLRAEARRLAIRLVRGQNAREILRAQRSSSAATAGALPAIHEEIESTCAAAATACPIPGRDCSRLPEYDWGADAPPPDDCDCEAPVSPRCVPVCQSKGERAALGKCPLGRSVACRCPSGEVKEAFCSGDGTYSPCGCVDELCERGATDYCVCSDGRLSKTTCQLDRFGPCQCGQDVCHRDEIRSCQCEDGQDGLASCGPDGAFQDCVCSGD